ncbi:(2Fe-2S)-binding protein [Streptomyces sp. NPDC054770]
MSLVCICSRVTESELIEACRSGCRTVDDLGVRTGAGQGCGDCRPDIEDLLVETSDQQAG